MDFDKETMRSLIIDHIDGKITGELAKYVDVHLEKNPDARKEYDELKAVFEIIDNEQQLDVPPSIKAEFLKAADLELKDPKETKATTISNANAWRVAAAIAFIITAYFGGSWILDRQEIKDLQSQLLDTKEQLLISMMKQESASERLKGIYVSQEFETVDDDIIDALVFTMNNDKNINVRIAATEALAKFSNNNKARSSLIASLNLQQNPAVQLKLIEILVSMGDTNAMESMKKMAENEDAIKTVRDEAQMGIFKLM